MPNIKFSYCYRDSANYKNHNFIVFANPKSADLRGIAALINSKLIDETWFYASQWGLPNLYPDTCNFEIDPTWHEFGGVEYAEELSTPYYSLDGFIKMLVL